MVEAKVNLLALYDIEVFILLVVCLLSIKKLLSSEKVTVTSDGIVLISQSSTRKFQCATSILLKYSFIVNLKGQHLPPAKYTRR